MVYTRNKLKLNKPHNRTLDPSTTMNIFKTLISALESPEGIKSQLLKSSYYLLIQLSTKQQLCLGKGADLNELFMKTNEGEVRLSLRDVCTLSNVLFKDLQRRLKQLHSSKHDVSATRSLELEQLNLLIRCCMVTLTFRVPQQHLLDSGRVLLLIFKMLSLLEVAEGGHGNVNFNKSLSCQCMYSGENYSDSFAKVSSLSSLELFEPCVPFITAILQVVIDELLVHSRLRKYLQIVDFFSSPDDRLFKHGASSGDFGVMMEMICSHFLLTISGEGALQEFLNRITWVRSNNSKSLEVSVIAARTLLQTPVVLSSPKLLQAHIVSLVSDVIGVCIDIESMTSDPRLIDSYLSVFESSVLLYTQHMSILKTEKSSTDAKDMHNESSHPCFELFIDPDKRQKLNQMITMLNDLWNSNLRKRFFKRKTDLVASSIEYIHQSLCMLDIECRDEALWFLRCMLVRAANDVNNIELPLNGDADLQDICLLASLLMLISNSLIQAVWCLRYGSDQPKSLKDLSEYDFIVGVINCFKEFSIRLPIQKFSYNMMEETHPTTSHEESRLMLLHFLGLLSLSFDSGLDFLVKSCISVIMALTNLFILEEGNIDVLMSLVGPPGEGSLVIYKEAPVSQYPTLRTAAKFQKIRTLYVSNACAANESMATEDVGSVALSMECADQETCRGEMYLKMRLKGSHGVDDFDDLADFVECKKGKDYDDWLKSRDKFRERKLRKGVKRRWEKKKQVWRSMKGKRDG
ncbi:uncharacterized protein LOC112504409 [Cynara cardunculus var. scolymus]|uniref:DUF7812 domain-containing protein n=1 Tax=Cynara cardunculus var. scolymus TaxID=59895 RepID=A0A103T5S1_CYNCS|nr:uncharacterized protein LOC112504409 [Cynara cardunculus var. scolymus]KVH07109.1 hypothetical protein Ccrd_025969 [Cynara cardunculus var. scolymus]